MTINELNKILDTLENLAKNSKHIHMEQKSLDYIGGTIGKVEVSITRLTTSAVKKFLAYLKEVCPYEQNFPDNLVEFTTWDNSKWVDLPDDKYYLHAYVQMPN